MPYSAPYLFERIATSLSFEEADILLREYYSGDTTSSEQLESMMLFQSFNGSCESSPDLCEDFRSYIAREGGIDYNWISNVLLDSPAPADDEDFIAYFARFNGIIDSHIITDLRRMLKCDQTPFPPVNYTVEEEEEEEGNDEEEDEEEGNDEEEDEEEGNDEDEDEDEDEGEDDDENKQVSLQYDTSLFQAAESRGLPGLYDHMNGSSYQVDQATRTPNYPSFDIRYHSPPA